MLSPPPQKNFSLSTDTLDDLIEGLWTGEWLFQSWPEHRSHGEKNHLAGGQTMQWISFLNDVISLFFLPQVRRFCNVTIWEERICYDSLTTVLQVTSEREISFVIVCVFYFQIWLLRADYELVRKSISVVQQTKNKTVQGSEGQSSGTATTARHRQKTRS